jgi:hypothetical protein
MPSTSYASYGMSGLRSVYTLASQTFLTPAAPRPVAEPELPLWRWRPRGGSDS